jgi:hypothetical protein
MTLADLFKAMQRGLVLPITSAAQRWSKWLALALIVVLVLPITAFNGSGSSSSARASSHSQLASAAGDAQNVEQPLNWSSIDEPIGGGAQPALKDLPTACQISAPATTLKECEGEDKSVTIGAGAPIAKCQGRVSLTVKGSPMLSVGTITINSGGTLELHDELFDGDTARVDLTTTGIHVNGGSLLIGDAACPIGTINPKATVTVTFTGKRPAPTVCGDITKGATGNCAGYIKGIQVEQAGTLRMYGLKGVPPNGINWTYLNQPAGDPTKFSKDENVLAPPPKPSNIIYTASRVDADTPFKGAWRADDWIAVATTSFSPWETEFAQIDTVAENKDTNCGKDKNQSCGASKIRLKQDLHFYHFGGTDPGDPSTDANYTAGGDTNFGVDERAEVGLISRNIIMTSDSDLPTSSKHWGGETRFLKGFNAVSLQGVELQKFGKEQIGGYPIHFHMDGDLSAYAAADKFIDSNSIDHSYNKCITVHSTQNVSYTNNVCARITGHIFYQEVGDESNVTFNGNLGMGAMSNSFDVNRTAEATRDDLIKNYYWVGDHMFTRPIPDDAPHKDFDQINIFDADSQYVSNTGTPASITFPSPRGQCGTLKQATETSFNSNGSVYFTGAPQNTTITCYPGNDAPAPPGQGNVYFEPPSGFWLLNPSAKLMNNSIAGCQDTGAAYWYATPPDASNNAVKFIPIGPTYPDPHGVFQNNRGHGCYRGLNDDQFELSTADQLFGYQTGVNNGGATSPQVDEFDGLTLSRIRYRGVWLRPSFFYLKDARLATNRRSISFVTSGGADGNYPGVWSLLGHSTLVGISNNNVDRFGPCGSKVIVNGVGQVRGAQYGCIDQTVPRKGEVATGGEFTENGYPVPDNNMFGFMSYDGPPLMVKDRFVNFLVNPSASLWTKTDQKVITGWSFVNAYKHYEGDAAIGWLDSNQSAYPTAASAKQLSFTNVDLRHQVYTDQVNIGQFNDGDKNTAILDLDGTLSGYGVVDPMATDGAFPASLNNLEFNASSNSVDECKAVGQQNVDVEGRPTAAMVPSGVGQLEFESLFPKNPEPWPPVSKTVPNLSQLLTFYKDTLDFGLHGSMSLHSRNGNGIWEPKVASSYGYVVRADPYTDRAFGTSGVGIPPLVDVSIVDTVKPKISATNPFYVQLGICYSNIDKSHPADMFTVTHGYKSWGGGGLQPTDLNLRKYFNQLQNLSPNQFCDNLDSANASNMNLLTGCPADGVTLLSTNPTCPMANQFVDAQGQMACRFPKNTPALTEAASLTDLNTIGSNGLPPLNNYFYDSTTGMLYFWIAQTDANAPGPSPLGNCTGAATDPPFCPQNTGANAVSTGEAYYNCPAEGCPTYRIVLNDASYMPGTSTCPVFGSTGDATGWANGTGGATWQSPPANQPTLVYAGTTTAVKRVQMQMPPPPATPAPAATPLPNYADASPPTCATTQP